MPRGNVTLAEHLKRAEAQLEQATIKALKAQDMSKLESLMEVLKKLSSLRDERPPKDV